MRLWKVFYDQELQRKIIRDSVNYSYWPGGTEDDRLRYVADALQFFMPTFKNRDFREEEERRLIFTPHADASPKPKFRARRGLLVPYLSLRELSAPDGDSLNFKLPIKSVSIGPGPHRALNMESTKMLLAKYGHFDVEVVASSTPYRG
jgi:hypothetical protein